MSELTVTLLRLGFLVLLWVFVLSVVAVLRRDLAPRRAGSSGSAAEPTGSASSSNLRSLVVTGGPLSGMELPLGNTTV